MPSLLDETVREEKRATKRGEIEGERRGSLDPTRGYPVTGKTPSSVSNPGVTSGMPAACKFRKHETRGTHSLSLSLSLSLHVRKFATVTTIPVVPHFSSNILPTVPPFSTASEHEMSHFFFFFSFLFWSLLFHWRNILHRANKYFISVSLFLFGSWNFNENNCDER